MIFIIVYTLVCCRLMGEDYTNTQVVNVGLLGQNLNRALLNDLKKLVETHEHEVPKDSQLIDYEIFKKLHTFNPSMQNELSMIKLCALPPPKKYYFP